MEYDKKLTQKLNEFFDAFDAVNLISKFGALNLVFENQNKNLLTTYATICGLNKINNNKPIASSKSFKQIVDELNNSNILPPIVDPSESPFFEKIYFGHDCHLFNGFNKSSVFIADNIIRLMIYHSKDLPADFVNLVLKISLCVSDISERIWTLLNINWNDIKEHKYSGRDLQLPPNLEQLRRLLLISKDELAKYVSNDIVEKYFICNNLVTKDIKTALRQEYPFYYSRPLYQIDDNNYLLVDPTSIGVFIRKISIELSKTYNCEEAFLKKYHDFIAWQSQENCKILSGIDYGAPEANIQLHQGSEFAQSFYQIGDSDLLYVLVVFDCGNENNYNNYSVDNIIKQAFFEALDAGYSRKNIYSIIVTSPFDGIFSVSRGFELCRSPLILNADELKAMRIVLSSSCCFIERFSNFLDYFFDEKNRSPFLSHVDLVSFLKSRKFDYYVNDECRLKTTIINLGFDFIYSFMVEAASKEEEISVSLPIFSLPLILIKLDDNTYVPNPMIRADTNIGFAFSRFSHYGLAICFNRKEDNSRLISKIILYWLNQLSPELSKIFNEDIFINVTYKLGSGLSIELERQNVCNVTYSLDFLNTENNDNSNEIKLIANLLSTLGLFSNDVANLLNKVSRPSFKKIGYKIDNGDSIVLSPMSKIIPSIFPSEMLESILEDQIGDFVINKLNTKFGDIDGSGKTANKIVEFLFEKFESIIQRYDWEQTIKFAYLCSESITRELLLEKDNLKHQQVLYPSHKDKIDDRYNRINISSVCSRFIVEYLSAIHTSGAKKMNYPDYQELITIINSIIRWAKISDAIFCGLIDKLIALKSYRITYNNNNLEKFYSIVTEVSSFDTAHTIDFYYKKFDAWPLKQEVNDAYLCDYGFTVEELMEIIAFLVSVGEEQIGDIKIETQDHLLAKYRVARNFGITDAKFKTIIDYLSLKGRNQFFDGTIKNRDLYPWKYNRTHSLMRKPIINSGNHYIWGNRLLVHSYLFIIQTIFNGKEPFAQGGKIESLNGKVAKFQGNQFNDYCFEYLKYTIQSDFIFEKNINVVNQKRIESSKNQPLGDIDILGIDILKKRIYLIETKNFFYTRDPYELDIEIKEMFGGGNSNKSYLKHELNRLDWARRHIDDFIEQYHLVGNDWKVFYTFLSDKPLVSCYFSNEHVNHIDIKRIDLKYLRSLK